MKHMALFAIPLAALAIAGCRNSSEPDTDATPTTASGDMGVASEPAMAMPSAAQTFADTSAASDTFEIESSRMAATKAQSAKLKSFAEQMIKAHTDSTAQLKTAAGAASPAITPAAQLTAAQQGTLDSLSAKSGADFDTAYAKAQVDAHQAALDGLKSYSASGDVPSLKAFALKMVPIVTAHLNMAKGL